MERSLGSKDAFRPQIPELPGGGVNGHFPEFHSDILDLSSEVGL